MTTARGGKQHAGQTYRCDGFTKLKPDYRKSGEGHHFRFVIFHQLTPAGLHGQTVPVFFSFTLCTCTRPLPPQVPLCLCRSLCPKPFLTVFFVFTLSPSFFFPVLFFLSVSPSPFHCIDFFLLSLFQSLFLFLSSLLLQVWLVLRSVPLRLQMR